MSRLHFTDEQYLAALRRLRERIAAGVKFVAYDDTTIGAKETHCSWGMCSKDAEQWPDPEDHLWPDAFVEHGRIAPKYREDGQSCPNDRRGPLAPGIGCFWACAVFQNRGPEPTRAEMLARFDERIAQIEARAAEEAP